MQLGKKKGTNYFAVLKKMADCSCKAATLLDDLLHNYTDITAKADAVHAVEHEADNLLHGFMHELNSAFITPIDREDLMVIGNGIDTITDTIEDAANLFDMYSIKRVDKEMFAMSELTMSACTALVAAVKEFEMFRSSKKLSGLIIEVNRIEEKGDVLHRSTLKALYNDSNLSVLDIIKWKDIYDTMEHIFDTCEDVADMLEGLAIKNK